MKDGISFSFYQSTRPQDVSEIGTSTTTVYAVIKELPDGGTFNLGQGRKCSFRADVKGEELDVQFSCPALYQNHKTLSVNGWAKCKLTQMSF